MNWNALLIVLIGFVLVVVGWQGTYAKIWSGFQPVNPNLLVPGGVDLPNGTTGNNSQSSNSKPSATTIANSLGIPNNSSLRKGQFP